MVTNNVSCPAGGKLINSSLNRYEWCLSLCFQPKRSPCQRVCFRYSERFRVPQLHGQSILILPVEYTKTRFVEEFSQSSRLINPLLVNIINTVINIAMKQIVDKSAFDLNTGRVYMFIELNDTNYRTSMRIYFAQFHQTAVFVLRKNTRMFFVHKEFVLPEIKI